MKDGRGDGCFEVSLASLRFGFGSGLRLPSLSHFYDIHDFLLPLPSPLLCRKKNGEEGRARRVAPSRSLPLPSPSFPLPLSSHLHSDFFPLVILPLETFPDKISSTYLLPNTALSLLSHRAFPSRSLSLPSFLPSSLPSLLCFSHPSLPPTTWCLKMPQEPRTLPASRSQKLAAGR